MIYKSYVQKSNTIISNSKLNTSLNPISELVYGKDFIVSRSLIYFDHSKVKELIENSIMVDMEKMKHTLHIKNAGAIDFTQLHDCETSSINDNKKIRATSFDLIFFLIPKAWDEGKGFDYSMNYLNVGYYSPTPIDPQRLISTDACNWFQRANGIPWDNGEKDELSEEEKERITDDYLESKGAASVDDLTDEQKEELAKILEDSRKPKYANGIYSNEKLSEEYDKWACGEESIVIGRQHFQVGNEDIELDITDTFNKFLNGELENYGIGIAYSPMLEITEDKYENYLGLLTNKTNTFFEPYVETKYSDVISDDRSNFVLSKNNRLYLYCTIGDTLQDLDNNPIVSIKNSDDEIVFESIESKKQSRGIYYIELNLSKNDFKADTMLYDVWGGISYQGTILDDVELDFTLKSTPNYFNIGNSLNVTNVSFTPSVSGIKEREQIKRGDIRKLIISAKPNYTVNTTQLVDNLDIRVYIKDGTSEIDVIGWDRINKAFTENFYVIDTNILIPQRYYVDIRITYGMNSIIHHDVLQFDIVNDLNNKYA